MNQSIQTELEKLRTSLAGLEAQRAILGEDVIRPAIQSLQEKIAALERKPGEEDESEGRRILTILFTDLVGSTQIAEKLDPEDYRELIAAVHDAAGKAIMQQHGTVLQYLGDGLLAAFGAQEVSEQDPENAVRAGLNIQRGCAALKTDPSIQVRVGIHTGLVLVGELKLAARQEFTATGDGMNLASRLQNAAPPGGVLISQDTYRYVRNLFDVTAQPPIQLKGKSESVQTYLVHRALPPVFRNATRGVAGIETGTIGRDEEMESLRKLCQEALDGNASFWVQLLGSPGIGKSRLVAEMMDFLEPRTGNFWLLQARAFQGDERQAYALVRRFWFGRLQIAEDVPLAEAEDRWVRGIQELAPVGRPDFNAPYQYEEEAAHALGLLIGLPFTDSPYLLGRRQDPAQVRGRAYVVSRSFVEALRAIHPVVILLEDLHWADSASWDYLVEVLLEPDQPVPRQAEPKHGIFILATARPEWKPPQQLLSDARYYAMDLKPLSKEASQTFVDHLLSQVKDVPKFIPSLLIERSEGVPYFIEELFNWLLDQGIIDRRSQPWRFIPERFQQVPLPGTLQHLLLARLGSIPPTEQRTLKRGAVYGRDFWESGVEMMGIVDSHALLTRAQERGFVIPQPDSTFEEEQGWSFYHNLLHQTAYESLLKRERKALHLTAATWLEAQAQRVHRLDEFAGLLGEHYDRAGQVKQAAHWYIIAGQRAKDRFALPEARRLADRSLELISPDDQEECWEALLLRSSVLNMLGETDAKQADLDWLLSLARATGNEHWLAEVFHRQGYHLSQTGDFRGSILAYEQAQLSAQRANDRATEALALSLMVNSLERLGEMNVAARIAEQALQLIPSFDDEIVQAMVMTNVSNYYGSSGDHLRTIEILEQQIEITHRLSNLYGEAIGLLNLGYEYTSLGQFERGSQMMEQSLQRSESIGARQQCAFTRLNLALAYWRLTRFQEAKRALEIALPELVSTGDAFGQGVSHTYLGLIFEGEQQVEAAMEQFAAACQVLGEKGIRGYVKDAVAGQARTALALGALSEARQYNQDLWEYLEQSSGNGMELPLLAYLSCYRVFERLGEAANAHLALEKGIQSLENNAERIDNPEWKLRFLENIPEHRELRDAWEMVKDG